MILSTTFSPSLLASLDPNPHGSQLWGGLMDSDPYYRTTFSVTRYLYITCCVVTLYNISGLSVSQRGTADLSSRVVRMAIDKKTD